MKTERYGAPRSPKQEVESAAPTPLFELDDFEPKTEAPLTENEILGYLDIEREEPVHQSIGNTALKGSIELVDEVRYPVSAAAIKERITRRQLSEYSRYDAYEELGGRTSTAEPFESVLEEYQPWQTDITAAIEQYGMAEMTVEKHAAMKPADKKLFNLHLHGFMGQIDAHRRMIGAAAGDVDNSQHLKDWYPKRSPEELIGYMSTLGQLKEELEKTGVPGKVREAYKASHAEVSEIARRRRAEKLEEFHRDLKKGAVRVKFVNNVPATERVAK